MDNLFSTYLLGMFLLGSYLVNVESIIYDCRADIFFSYYDECTGIS